MTIPRLTVIHEPYPLTQDFRRDWERLYRLAPGANVFSTLEWMEAGWQWFASREEVIRPVRICNASGDTVAMALHKEGKSPRAWGHLATWRTVDYNAQRIVPFLAVDLPHLAGALMALYEDVAGRIDVFDFFKLDPLDDGLRTVCEELAPRGLRPRLSVFNEQPQLRLPDDWEAYYRSHSGIFWKTPRRMRRRMAEAYGSVAYRRLRTPDPARRPLDGALDRMAEVFERSWQVQTMREEGNVSPEAMQGFYWTVAQAGLQRGSLDLNLLYAGERLTAFDLNLVEGATVYMICGMYDGEWKRYSPGRILFIDELQDGHGRGDRVYEFGGEYLGYKEEWTQEKVPAYHMRILGRTLTARIRSLMELV